MNRGAAPLDEQKLQAFTRALFSHADDLSETQPRKLDPTCQLRVTVFSAEYAEYWA